MFIIHVTKKAQKDISKLPKNLISEILIAIKELENFPKVTNIKKLVNFSPSYRRRVGNYRILFDVEKESIIIGRILHRKEAY
jgi:mRNA interferase RelE/StbE